VGIANVFVETLFQLLDQLVAFVPKVIVALLIWGVGKHLLNLAVRLVKRIDLKGTKIDNQLADFLARIVVPVGKFLLVLIVLDYLAIGRTIINAFMSGLAFAIAIGLGIAFGEALKPDAKKIVQLLRKQWQK